MVKYLSAQHLNPEDVERLATNIFRAHVDDAFHPKFGAHSSCGYSVLASACFRDDSGLSSRRARRIYGNSTC